MRQIAYLAGGARYSDLRLLSVIKPLPLERKKHDEPYKQLSLQERRKIEKWRAAKISVDVIAERLGRNRSTIFRELRRNHYEDSELPDVVGYFGVVGRCCRTDA
ncbi:helix-turn-helix domain-containing protein [Phaeobacter sp. 11ANDIMAR09]|uniref:helix-turn-helix domain-containing protein n=1 Tax=Phaeobacter sp. 11ANDIMAR09 TaxID=1225647 RepID=UPI0009FAC0B3